MRLVAGGGPRHEAGARELRRLGGAALPFVLPSLEALPPDARGRVAVALAPVADRMGISHGADLMRPEAAALFWTRFWDDRALDFTRTAVDRAVDRLVEHGTDLREADLVSVDTYALPELVARDDDDDRPRRPRAAHPHRPPRDRARAASSRRDATPEAVRRAVADWREWWFVHAADFVPLDGAGRAIAQSSPRRATASGSSEPRAASSA